MQQHSRVGSVLLSLPNLGAVEEFTLCSQPLGVNDEKADYF